MTKFQKIVLSLVSGLSTSEDELRALQKEFIRLDYDKDGKIGKDELVAMTSGKISKQYNIDWDKIISDIEGENGEKFIDF